MRGRRTHRTITARTYPGTTEDHAILEISCSLCRRIRRSRRACLCCRCDPGNDQDRHQGIHHRDACGRHLGTKQTTLQFHLSSRRETDEHWLQWNSGHKQECYESHGKRSWASLPSLSRSSWIVRQEERERCIFCICVNELDFDAVEKSILTIGG